MKVNKNNIIFWYNKNLGKIVFLLLVTVVLTLIVTYVPYLNIVLSSSVGFLLVFLIWYVLFSPSLLVLVVFLLIALLASSVTDYLRLDFISEPLGVIMYVLLMLALGNYIKDFLSRNRKLQ